jgi:hypothetical protein
MSAPKAIVAFHAALTFIVMSWPTNAQLASTEWTAASRGEGGNCESGGIVDVLERPSWMRLRFYVNEMRYEEVTIDLAADGEGRGEFHGKLPHAFANVGKRLQNEADLDQNRGVFKHEIVHVPPGRGKRPLETRQSRGNGDCHWIWIPQ